MGSRVVQGSQAKRWGVAVGLLAVAGSLLAWSLAKAGQDPAIPTEAAPAGAYPSVLDESETAAPKASGGAHHP